MDQGSGNSPVGLFYRNSANRIPNVTDGLSNTGIVGERCAADCPATWTGAVTGARTPAWMATTPWASPNTPPSQCQDTGNGTAYDNADFDEALCLGHGNATHVPDKDVPFFDPDALWSFHPVGVNPLFGDGSVHLPKSGANPKIDQHLMIIAGGETIDGGSY